ncbi:MAG: hypothetical protein KJP09_09100 [Bacteroidia bacterium]|nr:hypothetical protein [Bacteroidia bacterium]NND12190.1 hypothetical protein [Flavobacteriaceae bacterium]MBT8310422.1 hypothetical protein [Bacteroidia bacterium]NNK28106.1 hypothetical protein [Flavobacteriaceae bacterium]NNL61097.1 hypothetical protein [Flavobacteriaceae bacterium]
MIKFFRHIRRNLIESRKTAKYLKYAIGEILLVVIGILIALQINNWNENRKASDMGKQFLSGIQEDLKKDLVRIDSIVTMNAQSISLITSIDSVFHRKHYFYTDQNEKFFNQPDTINFQHVFYRDMSFRSIKGNYKSLIADGKTGLIKNKELFQALQLIYDENQARLSSTYDAIKAIEQNISWAYGYEKYNWTYSDLKNAKDKKIFLDLVNFTEQKYWHALNLLRTKNNSAKVIAMIEKELAND